MNGAPDGLPGGEQPHLMHPHARADLFVLTSRPSAPSSIVVGAIGVAGSPSER
jgi:hypothetical protein